VFARAALAMCHAELGTFAEGGALGAEGLRIAEAAAHPASLMWAYWGVGRLSLCQGDLHRALPWLERAVCICQEADLPAWFPRMAAVLGQAYTLVGRAADAVALLTQALEQSVAWERAQHEALCRLSLGEVQVSAGCLEEAHALAARTLTLAREHHQRGHQAHALYLFGEIAVRREPPEAEQAKAYYCQALVVADELGMRPLLAHCHRGLSMLYSQTGRQAQARTELLAAITLYRTMDMTFWLPDTEASLAHIQDDAARS
jgi:tetratricopeptide (TPR) repeat protein